MLVLVRGSGGVSEWVVWMLSSWAAEGGTVWDATGSISGPLGGTQSLYNYNVIHYVDALCGGVDNDSFCDS